MVIKFNKEIHVTWPLCYIYFSCSIEHEMSLGHKNKKKKKKKKKIPTIIFLCSTQMSMFS